jgi:hypothetical protein
MCLRREPEKYIAGVALDRAGVRGCPPSLAHPRLCLGAQQDQAMELSGKFEGVMAESAMTLISFNEPTLSLLH